MLWHPQNPAKSCYVQCFFFILAVFPLPESYQNDPKFHFNTLLRSDTQKSSKNVENTTVFWSRCETVFAPPPPPAKADIATAILTNVIEHLVLLFCPPISKHAFTAKAVWADLNRVHLGPMRLKWKLHVLTGAYTWFQRVFCTRKLRESKNPHFESAGKVIVKVTSQYKCAAKVFDGPMRFQSHASFGAACPMYCFAQYAEPRLWDICKSAGKECWQYLARPITQECGFLSRLFILE